MFREKKKIGRGSVKAASPFSNYLNAGMADWGVLHNEQSNRRNYENKSGVR